MKLDQHKLQLERIAKAIELLSEHFDTVHIFCTIYENGETEMFDSGTGNWCARYGQVDRWVNQNSMDREEEDDED